jgi:hypothetical protein
MTTIARALCIFSHIQAASPTRDALLAATDGGSLEGLSGVEIGVAGTRLCEPGYWCDPLGTAHPCPGGWANPLSGALSVASCSVECVAGFYCPPGSADARARACGAGFYCVAGSAAPKPLGAGFFCGGSALGGDGPAHTCASRAACPAGHFCGGGASPTPCAAGRFAPGEGGATASACAPCAAGYFCAGSSTSTTATPCGDAGVFCPPGSGAPRAPRAGFFTAGEDGRAEPGTAATRSQELPCPRGYFCVDGVRTPCAAGRFGAEPRSASPACSGACEEGYFCPPGSSSARERECGGAALYCPAASGAPLPVPTGAYSIAAGAAGAAYVRRLNASAPGALPPAGPAPPAPPRSCAAAWAAVGEAGAEAAALLALATPGSALEDGAARGVAVDVAAVAAGAGTRARVAPCPPGSFCRGGIPHACPGGRWGGAWSETREGCAGACAPGFYCPPGSATPLAVRCGNASFFCPEGSASPTPVPTGDFSTGGWGALGGPTAALGEGGFLPPLACGAEEEPESDLSLLPAPPAAAAARAGPPLPAGASPAQAAIVEAVFGAALGRAGTLLRAPCGPPAAPRVGGPQPEPAAPLRRACSGGGAGGLGGEATRTAVARCPAGSYCGAGLRFLCAPGFFSVRDGATSCEPCAAGSFCALGAAAPVGCGAAPSQWCPPRAASPVPVRPGWAATAARDGEVPCAAGTLCAGGEPTPCPPGFFCVAAGLTAPTGACPPGFFCPAGTVTPRPCGGAHVFCPGEGAQAPRRVRAGFFSTRAPTPGAPPLSPWLPPNITATAETPCAPGWFCQGGVARQCPAGTFGGEGALASAACSGPCAAGHFCPPGSVSATAQRCGDAFLLLVDVAASLPVQAALASDPALPSTDGIPTTHPLFSAAALRGLYAALGAAAEAAGGGALFGAPSGDGGGAFAGGAWSARATIPLRPRAATAGAAAAAAIAAAPSVQVELALLVAAQERMLQVSAVLPPGAVPASFSLSGDAGGGDLRRAGVTVALPGGGVNFSATLPWRAALRLRLPDAAVPLESFAATRRALLRGGPTSVFCPPGAGWPTPVPPGHFGNASARALRALAAGAASLAVAEAGGAAPFLAPPLPAPAADAAAAAAANATQDQALPAPPGFYASGGALHPCPRGTYRGEPRGEARAGCAPCPAGSACRIGAAAPTPCAEGFYASDGAWECAPCPGGAAPQTPVNGAEAAAQSAPGAGADLMGRDYPAQGAMGGAAAPAPPRCRTDRRCCE